jgi:NADPH:quinone reductase-like Zn-dependent oxidoreductase
LIVDIGGNSSLSRLRRALTPKGRLVITGGEGGGKWLGGVDRQLRAAMLSPFIAQKLTTFIAAVSAGDLMVLKGLIEEGKVSPVVDRTYSLSEVPKAIDYLDEGHARGKVAITL